MGLWKKRKSGFSLNRKKYLSLQPQFDRDVAQLASAPRSDVEVGCSSHLIPTH